MAQIQKMTGTSSFNDSGDSSMLRDEELNSNNNEYLLSLKVNFKTNYGEEIAVVGSIEQLGNWDTSKALKMKWTDGHNWVADNIRISQSKGDPTHFMYKYALMRKGRHQYYEKGFNRIADLKLLKPIDYLTQGFDNNKTFQYSPAKNWNHSDFVYDSYPKNNDKNNLKKVKCVQINDCWEHY